MGELTTTRWRKYGKDRLYVNDGDGRRLGWLDLISRELHVVVANEAVRVTSAVEAFCARESLLWRSEGPPLTIAVEVGSLAAPAGGASGDGAGPKSWVDLAAHVPGQLVRAQADLELADMRQRSRLGAVIARAFDMKTDERAYRVGADGEETVGGRLDKLRGRGWHVLHSVPVGQRGSDIDHVLIGPGGVWTINTKNHPGARVWVGQRSVRVNGYSQPYLHKSRSEAERATKLLTTACGFPVHVRPALVFLTGTLFPNVTVTQQPEGVAVLDRMDLPGAFKRSRRLLTDDEVAAIYAMARRSTTWTDGNR